MFHPARATSNATGTADRQRRYEGSAEAAEDTSLITSLMQRARLMILLLLVVAAAVAGAWWWRQRLKRSKSAEELAEESGVTGGQPIVDLEIVETYCDEAALRLLDWGEQLRHKDFSDKDGVLAPGFSGRSLALPPEQSRQNWPAGIARVEHDLATAAAVDRAGFLSSLRQLFGDWRTVEWLRFDLTRADFVNGPPIVGAIEWQFEVIGDDAAGRRRSYVMRGPGELRRENRRWCVAHLEPTTFETLERDRPLFTEVSKAAGVAEIAPDFDNLSYAWEGAATADLDGDGRLDLFVPDAKRSFLYMADPAGGFVEQAELRGLAGATDPTGVVFFDFDNDHDLDLALADESILDKDGTASGHPFRLLRCDGGSATAGDGGADDWHYVDVTAETAGTLRSWFTTLVVLDHDGDGWLDLFLCTYGDLARVRNNKWTHADNAPQNVLLRNVGGKRFEDVATAAGLTVTQWALAAAAADVDGDGDDDLYVANDYGPNQLFVNDGKGHFTDRAVEQGVLDVGFGMSASFGDLDNDGLLDLYVANMCAVEGDRILARLKLSREQLQRMDDVARGNSLFLRRGAGFERMPATYGATAGRWGWGSQIADLDNDGRLDLTCVNGFITRTTFCDIRSLTWRQMVASTVDAAAEPSVRVAQQVNSKQYRQSQYQLMWKEGWSYAGRERDKVWLNSGAGFLDVSDVSGADSAGDGRALLAADFDDDGDIDLFNHEMQRSRHRLFRNDIAQPSGRFVKVQLEATTRHWSAVNAQVLATFGGQRCAQTLAIGNAYISCQPYELLFGTGDAIEVALEVFWPGGKRESFGTVKAGSRVRLVEGEGKVRELPARTRALARE